ncbi:hypothetical protein J7384_16905 [Endozoicomonas sp. G2_1]|uniref:hypothetical protein n=1 Tax=Endozoicomonas sp. G2_1 TaxID=2821091 RepID=UPI001ADAF681|nr:hypothetical protein [Endozoicomonas sp. G2_1]MBO9492043.1 hypothetical protein [Endozoicomonas sp. G2_1]
MVLIKAFLPLISVLAIWIGFVIYFGAKIKRHRKSLVRDDSAPVNCLTLTRGVEPTNYFRKYKVYVDEVAVGEISSGEVKHFEMAPGKHTVSVAIDWCKSRPFEFEASDGNNTKLQCGANYNNWKCIFMHVIKPSRWIYVKVA